MSEHSSPSEHVGADLVALLAVVGHGLTDEQVAIVKGFIEEGEYGVALDWTMGYLAERGVRLEGDALSRIDDLAARMGMSKTIEDERRILEGRS